MILNLEFAGEKQVTAGLTGLLKRIKDIRPLTKPWDWRLRRNVEQHFRGEGTHKGRWASLASSTQIQRVKMGYSAGHPILVRTGDLKRSLILRSNSKHILVANRKFMEFGSKIPYALYHQTGTKTPMPARKMLLMDAKTLSRIIEDARRYIMDNRVFKG